MPIIKLIDDIELHGVRFRLHRIRGFAAFEAKAAWASVVGERGAHLLTLSSTKVAEMAERIMSTQQRAALAELGGTEYSRALALLGILQCMDRGTMTPQSMRLLASHFILGHVEILDAHGPTMIQQFADLDTRLDGSEDADVWSDLLWRQIPFCLGPSIAVDGTGRASAPTAKT